MDQQVFRIRIKTDSDALAGGQGYGDELELARILRALADRLSAYECGTAGPLRDINGNTVGTFDYVRPGYYTDL